VVRVARGRTAGGLNKTSSVVEGWCDDTRARDPREPCPPIVFTIGPPGQPAQTTRFLMNQTIIKTPAGWKVASILPIPVPVQAAGIP
jgi:hypothetical protein